MMNEETKASLNKFLKEREERIKNMTLAEARDIVSRIYGHSDMRMESDKALQILLDCADKALEQTRWIPVSERLPEEQITIGKYVFSENVLGTEGYTVRRAYYNYTTKEWFDGNEEMKWPEIIAWMPLPEPYKEDTK